MTSTTCTSAVRPPGLQSFVPAIDCDRNGLPLSDRATPRPVAFRSVQSAWSGEDRVMSRSPPRPNYHIESGREGGRGKISAMELTPPEPLPSGMPPLAILTVGAPESGSSPLSGVSDDFSETLRQFAARHPGADVVVTSAGAELPFAWDARLRKAAYAASSIAAAVPMCAASALHALVEAPLRREPRAVAASIDRAAYCMGERSYYEIPRLHPVCAYLRRDALDLALASLPSAPASPQDVLDALARRWRSMGWSCVICDFLYVGFDGELPAPGGSAGAIEDGAFLAHHPLGALRRAVNDA